MASGIYSRFLENLMNGEVDLEADVINVALYDVVHGFTVTDTDYTTDNELPTAGGYTQGGQALDTKAVATAGVTTAWDADNEAWAAATFTAFHAVIYDVSVSNDLIASIDFGGAKTVAAGTFTIQWDASGIITLAE